MKRAFATRYHPALNGASCGGFRAPPERRTPEDHSSRQIIGFVAQTDRKAGRRAARGGGMMCPHLDIGDSARPARAGGLQVQQFGGVMIERGPRRQKSVANCRGLPNMPQALGCLCTGRGRRGALVRGR